MVSAGNNHWRGRAASQPLLAPVSSAGALFPKPMPNLMQNGLDQSAKDFAEATLKRSGSGVSFAVKAEGDARKTWIVSKNVRPREGDAIVQDGRECAILEVREPIPGSGHYQCAISPARAWMG